MPRKQDESRKRLGLFTMIYRDRWHNRRFVDLPWDEKATLFMVETFDGITSAGVIRAEPAILAQKQPDKPASDIDALLTSLHEKQWIARSGSEVFVMDWFIRQPQQLKSANNVKSMQTAINRIGYDDLRATVIAGLFSAILEVERVDKAPTSSAVKRVCAEIAEQHNALLPDNLASRGKS